MEVHPHQEADRAVRAAYFRNASSGYLATRASDDVQQLGALMAGTWIEAMNSAFVLVVGAALMTALSPGRAAWSASAVNPSDAVSGVVPKKRFKLKRDMTAVSSGTRIRRRPN